jgi:hypothetical protein
MAFLQIMELNTSRFEEMERLSDEWRKATEGKRTLRREIVARDRNDPTRHLVLAFFDSYESAMENSNLEETGRISAGMAGVVDSPVVFTDLDILEDRAG